MFLLSPCCFAKMIPILFTVIFRFISDCYFALIKCVSEPESPRSRDLPPGSSCRG